MNTPRQQGIGLIEVMIALAVLMIGALAVGMMITSSLVTLHFSGNHFEIDSLSQEMLENIRANPAAARSGLYNTLYEADVPAENVNLVSPSVDLWKTRISSSLPDGAGQIECDVDNCVVSMRWKENLDGNFVYQYYQLNSPI